MVKNSIKIYARLKQEYRTKTAPYVIYKSDKEEIITFRFCHFGVVRHHKSHISRYRKYSETKSSDFFLKNYRFEQIFDQNSTQTELFDGIAKPVVHSVIEGFNGTIFAYGQTGSGKTYAITGSSKDYVERGLIPRSIEEIFCCINKAPEKYTIFISYLEIYNEVCYDLLNPKSQLLHLEELRVILLEDGKGKSHLRNLTVQRVSSEQEAMRLLLLGDANRTIAETPMNEYSSRSHCIFTISINSRIATSGKLRKSKLNLVDLAGSERICKSDISGTTLNEAKHINLSLHYLEQVILALSQRKSHIPFRNSMLTYVLKDSLSGNCKTVLLATLSLNKRNIEETLATCKFAQRVAEVSMEATINEEADPLQEIECLKTEIEELRKQLLQQSTFKVSGCLTKEEKQQWKNVINNYLDDAKDDIPFTTFDMRLITYSFKLLKDAVKSREDQKAKLKSETGNKEVIQQYESVIKQKEDEISILKTLLCSNVESHPKCSTSFSCSESDDSILNSYVEQEKENIPPNSDSFTLSPGQKVAFEVFMKDTKNTTELDYYKQAILDMFNIAKKITLVVEQCQQNISAVRAKPRPDSAGTDSIESELHKHQTRYKNSLQKLHDLKNKTAILTNGLERAKMKILIRFKQWYDNISCGDHVVEEKINNVVKNSFSNKSGSENPKTKASFDEKCDSADHSYNKIDETNSRPQSPVNSRHYKYQKRWQQRDHSPCSTISSKSGGTDGEGNFSDNQRRNDHSRPKTPSRIPTFSRKHKNVSKEYTNGHPVEVETVFEGIKNLEKDSNGGTTPKEIKQDNENSDNRNSGANELIAPPNSETKSSRTKIPNDSYYHSKLGTFYELNSENLSTPLNSPNFQVHEAKTDDDNSSNISKDYSLWDESLKKPLDFKNYIGKVRSPYKNCKTNVQNNLPRPKTATNMDKSRKSVLQRIHGPQRPEHLNYSSSFDPNYRASSARSARSDYRKYDTVYKMIMGYDAVEPIDSMRPFSADSPALYEKYNPKHRIGVSHVQSNRCPVVSSSQRYSVHSPPHRHRNLRSPNYNSEQFKFSKIPEHSTTESIEEQETLDSVFHGTRPENTCYASSSRNSADAFGMSKRISPERERLMKETDYNFPTTLHQSEPDYDIPSSRRGMSRTLHRTLRPDSAGKEAYYSKMFFPEDSSRFKHFISTIPLTGDFDVDEEIVKFYRSKFV